MYTLYSIWVTIWTITHAVHVIHSGYLFFLKKKTQTKLNRILLQNCNIFPMYLKTYKCTKISDFTRDYHYRVIITWAVYRINCAKCENSLVNSQRPCVGGTHINISSYLRFDTTKNKEGICRSKLLLRNKRKFNTLKSDITMFDRSLSATWSLTESMISFMISW